MPRDLRDTTLGRGPPADHPIGAERVGTGRMVRWCPAARPVLINKWYSASQANSAARMSEREYIEFVIDDVHTPLGRFEG